MVLTTGLRNWLVWELVRAGGVVKLAPLAVTDT